MKPGDLLGAPDRSAGASPFGPDPAPPAAPVVTAAIVVAADVSERRPAPPIKSSRGHVAALQRGAGHLYEAPPPPNNDRLCDDVAGAVPAWAPVLVGDLATGLLDGAALDERPDPRIVGSGDRAHQLALINGAAVPAPRRPSADPLMRLPGARPTSRATCERRCGSDGFCDPSSPYGCGGEFCQGFEGRLY